jgi:hypothetical protein
MPSSEATFDLKKMAYDTTFQLHVKFKNLRWWRFRVWLVARFASLMRWLLGSAVEVELDYSYDASE